MPNTVTVGCWIHKSERVAFKPPSLAETDCVSESKPYKAAVCHSVISFKDAQTHTHTSLVGRRAFFHCHTRHPEPHSPQSTPSSVEFWYFPSELIYVPVPLLALLLHSFWTKCSRSSHPAF